MKTSKCYCFHFHNWSYCVLIFYCCITNYNKFRDLKQYPFIISQSCHSDIGHSITGFSAQDLTRLTSRCQPSCTPFCSSGSCFKFMSVLTVFISMWLYGWGLHFLVGYCLGDHSQVLDAANIFYQLGLCTTEIHHIYSPSHTQRAAAGSETKWLS